jgi:hypothetical protein
MVEERKEIELSKKAVAQIEAEVKKIMEDPAISSSQIAKLITGVVENKVGPLSSSDKNPVIK